MLDPEGFLTWYSGRRERTTGHGLTKASVASMKSRIGTSYRASGAETVEQFAGILTDEPAANRILDKLSETNSTGALRLCYEACKAYHSYALFTGLELGPFAMERPAKNPRKPIRVYSSGELDLLLRTAPKVSPHWFAFLATFAHTGRRVGEILGLRWEWLHLDVETPYFDLPTTKNKRQAFVPLDSFLTEEVFTPESIAHMQSATRFQVRDPHEYVFPWNAEKTARNMFVRHCERVDVPYLGFHCFRHTRATEMLARGVPMHAVSALLGHASVQTTDRVYNHTTALTFAHYLESETAAPATPERLPDGRAGLRLVKDAS